MRFKGRENHPRALPAPDWQRSRCAGELDASLLEIRCSLLTFLSWPPIPKQIIHQLFAGIRSPILDGLENWPAVFTAVSLGWRIGREGLQESAHSGLRVGRSITCHRLSLDLVSRLVPGKVAIPLPTLKHQGLHAVNRRPHDCMQKTRIDSRRSSYS